MALISPSHRQQLSEGAVPLSKSVNLSTNPSRWLVSSPYLGSDHLLDLETVDRQSRLFAIALTNLSPATENYAAVNYEKAFDFDELMASLRSVAAAEGVQWRRQVFYVVEFRSKLRVEIDNDLLYSLDKMSHAEATQSGGLLKYWYGVPDGDRRNLATCEFASRRHLVFC